MIEKNTLGGYSATAQQDVRWNLYGVLMPRGGQASWSGGADTIDHDAASIAKASAHFGVIQGVSGVNTPSAHLASLVVLAPTWSDRISSTTRPCVELGWAGVARGIRGRYRLLLSHG